MPRPSPLPLCFLLALAAASLLAGGCVTTTQRFDVRVKNDTAGPLTVGLTKERGPFEDAWASPEEIIGRKKNVNGKWGMDVVWPHTTVATRDVAGEFPPGARGVLRVYVGDLTLGEMAKVRPGSPGRLDLTLKPGENDFVITLRDGRLAAK